MGRGWRGGPPRVGGRGRHACCGVFQRRWAVDRLWWSSRHRHDPGAPGPAEQPLWGTGRQGDRAALPGRRRHPARRGAGRQRPGRRGPPPPAPGRPVPLLALRRLPEQARAAGTRHRPALLWRVGLPPSRRRQEPGRRRRGRCRRRTARPRRRAGRPGRRLAGASTALLAGAALRPPVAAVVSLSTGKFDLSTILGGSSTGLHGWDLLGGGNEAGFTPSPPRSPASSAPTHAASWSSPAAVVGGSTGRALARPVSAKALVDSAEEVGFEPTGPSRVRRLSRSLPSAARPLLRAVV